MVGTAGPSLRILITNIQLKARSGTEIVTMEMARGLARRGRDVVVFSPDWLPMIVRYGWSRSTN
jgi:hypothetical protein